MVTAWFLIFGKIPTFFNQNWIKNLDLKYVLVKFMNKVDRLQYIS